MIDRQIHDWVEHSSQFRSGEPQPLTGFLKICVPEAVVNIFVRLGSETKLNPRLLRAWCSLFCLARGKRSIGAIGRGSRKRCATKGFQRVSITYLSTASGFGYCYSLKKRPKQTRKSVISTCQMRRMRHSTGWLCRTESRSTRKRMIPRTTQINKRSSGEPKLSPRRLGL